MTRRGTPKGNGKIRHVIQEDYTGRILQKRVSAHSNSSFAQSFTNGTILALFPLRAAHTFFIAAVTAFPAYRGPLVDHASQHACNGARHGVSMTENACRSHYATSMVCRDMPQDARMYGHGATPRCTGNAYLAVHTGGIGGKGMPRATQRHTGFCIPWRPPTGGMP